MPDLKIKIFEKGKDTSQTTITIPGNVLKIASKLIPQKIKSELEKTGINLDELVNIAENKKVTGTLIEIEENEKNTKIIIGLE